MTTYFANPIRVIGVVSLYCSGFLSWSFLLMKYPFLQRYLSVYFPIVISIFIGGGLSLMISLIHWSAEVYKVQTNFEPNR